MSYQHCSNWECKEEIPDNFKHMQFRCMCGKVTTVKKNAAAWIGDLAIVSNTYEDPPNPIPFTLRKNK